MRAKHAGEPKALEKKKELELYQEIQKAGVTFQYQHHLPFRACGLNSETTCAFVDFSIAKSWGYVLIECDEDQHRSYDTSCDVRRDFDMAASVALSSGHKLRIIRYNPDGCRVAGRTCVESRKDRTRHLLALLEEDEPDWSWCGNIWDETAMRLNITNRGFLLNATWQVLVASMDLLCSRGDWSADYFGGTIPPIRLTGTTAEKIISGLAKHPFAASANRFRQCLLAHTKSFGGHISAPDNCL